MVAPQVSIIIPVYNVEKYLEECLNSVVHQTYKNIEVILIDDGSTDNSGKICDNYSLKYNNIKIFHKNNSGIADTRNFGIAKATSDYIFFLDSDDFISEDCIELLIKALLKNDCDIAICDEFQFIDGQSRKSNLLNSSVKKSKYFIFSNVEATAKSMLLRDLNTSPCRFVAKKGIMAKIPFPVGRVYEDVATMPKIYFEAEKIFYSKEQKYYYRHRPDSITHTNKVKTKTLVYDELLAAEELFYYFKEKCPSILFSATDLLVNISIDVIRRAKDAKIEEDCEELIAKSWSYIKYYRKQIILNDKCNKNTRIKCIISFLGAGILSFVVNLYKKYKEGM